MDSGAINVGRTHLIESMIVGQDRGTIASQTLFHGEPLQLCKALTGTFPQIPACPAKVRYDTISRDLRDSEILLS